MQHPDPLVRSATHLKHFSIVLGTTIVFDLLFWQRSLGLNVTLFLLLVAVLMLLQQRFKVVSIPARITFAGLLVSAIMVYVYNSTTAFVAAIVSIMATVVFMRQHELRSLIYALCQFINDLFRAPVIALEGASELFRVPQGKSRGWRWARLGFMPLVVVFIFFQLYRGGNAQFGELTAGMFDGLLRIVSDLFELFFTFHAIFFLLALLLCSALLMKYSSRTLLAWEQQWTDLLLRKKVRRQHWQQALPMDPLERERRKGIMLLALVNLLLLVVNAIDINWIWFGFTVEEGTSLKAFVHEGTWLLIISILLSIGIMLYLFRGNQNFYWRNGPLRQLAVLWVAQNFVLGISVFLRNYHYIAYHGLAYKRIGVMVFLILVLVGLFTLYLKIRDKKSLFYLVRVNCWAAFIAMISLTLVDWDLVIVRYNLAHENPAEVDIDNYLLMSDKVLPLLYGDMEKVEAQMIGHSYNRVRWVEHLDPEKFRAALDRRKENFMHRYEVQHWLERSWAERRTYRALQELEQQGAFSAATGANAQIPAAS